MRQIRWGFIGAGGIARQSMAPALQAATGAELWAAAARDPERAKQLHPRLVYKSYSELLNDPEIEVVYIALHNSAHLEWTLHALRAGKHVVCEKPLGLTANEVMRMSKVAKIAGRLLVEACWNRWHPRTRELERMIKMAKLGTIHSVEITFIGLLPQLDGYRRNPILGGGALYDIGCYAVAGVLLSFGWMLPTSVSGHWHLTPSLVDSTTTAELFFPEGNAILHVGLTGELEEQFVIHGDRGSIELTHPAFTAGTAPAHLVRRGPHENWQMTFPSVNPYRLMVEQFSAAVQGKPAYLVNLEQSLATAIVIDMVRAAATGSARRTNSGCRRA